MYKCQAKAKKKSTIKVLTQKNLKRMYTHKNKQMNKKEMRYKQVNNK